MKKVLVLFVLILAAFCALIWMELEPKAQELSSNSEYFDRLLIRPLHYPGEIPAGYIKVSEDVNTDRAFYLNTEVSGFKRDYTSVSVKGQKDDCKVIQQFNNYLLVLPNELDKIYAGLSGSLVCSEDGEEIGFISEITKEGLLKVVANH